MKQLLTIKFKIMEVRFTEFKTGRELLLMTTVFVIPREKERLFVDETLYEVHKVYHHYKLNSLNVHVEIELLKI